MADETLSNETQSPLSHIVITVIILGLVFIIGTIGNISVLLVYLRRKNHHSDRNNQDDTDRFFIITLAVSDLIVCLFIVPATVIVELYTFHISLYFCKSYYLFNTANLIFSTMLIALIAIDRCLCIKYALYKILTVNKAKICICLLLILALVMGVISSVVVDSNPHTHFFDNSTVQTAVCEEIVHNNRSNSTRVIFYEIVEILNHSTYYISIIIVILCYSLVYVEIIKLRKRECDFQLLKFQAKGPIKSITEVSSSEMYSSPNEDSLINPRRSVVQSLKDSTMFRNIKSAAMLFVVAVVYIVVFSPVLLISSFKIIDFNLILYNLYYVNNAANPVVYCFMNSSFRRDLRSLFKKYSCCFKSISSDEIMFPSRNNNSSAVLNNTVIVNNPNKNVN